MTHRYRRLRSTKTMRDIVRETTLSGSDLIQPFFVTDGKRARNPIAAMPGISRFSIDVLQKEIEIYIRSGGKAALLFGVSSAKDATGKHAASSKSPVATAVRAIKKNFPDFVVITDVCLCAYMTHGHCGIIKNGQVDNDLTLPVLSQMAIAHAEAGADIIFTYAALDYARPGEAKTMIEGAPDWPEESALKAFHQEISGQIAGQSGVQR